MFRNSFLLLVLAFTVAEVASSSVVVADSSQPTALNTALNLDPVVVGGFIDTYAAYDLNEFQPRTRDYLTQPVRDREPNVNLAFLEGKLDTGLFRGRLAAQVGTSVDTNYSAEPSEWTRYLQEAWLGYHLSEKIWLDGGIYLSHIGPESFISRDNWSYTRLLMSEFSPYYESGFRLNYQQSEELSFQIHLVNGWQNISDFGDHHPSLGTQVNYLTKDGTTFSYNTFLGAEAEGIRFFNDFYAKIPVSKLLDLGACFDVGLQQRDSSHPHSEDTWFTWALLSRLNFSDDFKATARFEQYNDRQNVIVSTTSGKPYDVLSSSLGVDYQLLPALWFRNEFRVFFGQDPIFRKGQDRVTSSDKFFVSSLSYTF